MFRRHLGLLVTVLTVRAVFAAAPRPSAENFYDRLGIEPTASTAEIKRAYRQAMLLFHPDRGGTTEDAMRLSEAYETLAKGRIPFRALHAKPPPSPWDEFRKAREAETRARREGYEGPVYTDLSRHFQQERRFLRRGDLAGALIAGLRLARALIPPQMWDWPGAEQAGLDFFNDYIWVQMPARSAAAFRLMFELWRRDGVPRALSRILLSNPAPSDLELVRAILDRREFFDPGEVYTAIPLHAWADSILELERQSWGTSALRQEFAPRFVALLHWRYVTEKNSAAGLSREAERSGVPHTVRAYWRLYFGSWTLQRAKDWANPHPPFPTGMDFCAENLKARTF